MSGEVYLVRIEGDNLRLQESYMTEACGTSLRVGCQPGKNDKSVLLHGSRQFQWRKAGVG